MNPTIHSQAPQHTDAAKTMPPIIPFEFDPCSSEFETEHLKYDPADKGEYVSWPAANVKLFVPPHDYHLHPSDLQKSNPNYFRMYGAKGFLAGSYAEILVSEVPVFMALKMGGIEVSFGRASPLAAYIFDYVHRSKYFGAWDSIHSARIIGVTVDNAEASFLNACMQYQDKTGFIPEPAAMDDSFLYEEEPEEQNPVTLLLGPIVKDLDPLRFYYFGLSQADNASACIYFYRTLEYFSFLINQSKLTKLRHDYMMSEAEFAKRVHEVLFKEEKGPLLQIINNICDQSDLQKALDYGIITSKQSGLLGESIYSFRNSIVHGKFSYGYALQSGSILDDDAQLPKWRALLQGLARKAVTTYGSTLI